ncbi:tyrosine-type recombinase/integrase [Streptomyces sp. NPDC058171]
MGPAVGGTRLLRHNAASRMLRAVTPFPTIAAVLGHASEESTKQYMNIDDERLLRCVLPVPQAHGQNGHGFTSVFATQFAEYVE